MYLLKINKALTTTNMTDCAVLCVGNHNVIKPPPRTALAIFLNTKGCGLSQKIMDEWFLLQS